jgi:hypothetical protein
LVSAFPAKYLIGFLVAMPVYPREVFFHFIYNAIKRFAVAFQKSNLISEVAEMSIKCIFDNFIDSKDLRTPPAGSYLHTKDVAFRFVTHFP